jgi:hypothetical protein
MPVNAADKVKPGKKAPLGKIRIPKTSPAAYAIPAQIGPYIMPNMATGRKPNPILKKGVLIDKNLVKIISSAMNKPIVINFVVLELFNIIKNSFQ